MPTSPSWGSRKRCQGQLTQGQLTQVTQVKTGTTTLASNASYYPNGALAQFTYGNGIVHTMTQNARQLPSHSVDGSVLDLSTVFDENGNVAAITDNTASARQTRSMSYDGLDRLTATTSPMFGTASYAYDPQDNLTRVQVTGGSQPRDHYYCYNASNQLAFVRSGPNCTGTTSPAVIALAYDVQGNLSIKNGASYAFDFGNRLRTTAGQSYRYDAQGRRVRQDVAGSQLQYSQYAADGRLVWQRDETTNQRIANAYLAGSLLAEISRPLTGSTTTLRYLHTDALGSPIAKTSASGAIIETSEYEPYGRLLNRANDNRAGYTGHVMDAASGLTYMQQRYYDPGIGRFLSVDPVTAYSNPMGAFNRYWYADGNPYRFTDPDGRQCRSCDAFGDQFKRDAEAGNMRAYAPFEKPALFMTGVMVVGPFVIYAAPEGAGLKILMAGLLSFAEGGLVPSAGVAILPETQAAEDIEIVETILEWEDPEFISPFEFPPPALPPRVPITPKPVIPAPRRPPIVPLPIPVKPKPKNRGNVGGSDESGKRVLS